MSAERESDNVLRGVLEFAEEHGVRFKIGPGEMARLASPDAMERRRAVAAVAERVVWDAFSTKRWSE